MQKPIAVVAHTKFLSNHTDAQQVIKNCNALAEEGVPLRLYMRWRWRELFVSKQSYRKKLIEFYNIGEQFKFTRVLSVPFLPFNLDRLVHAFVAVLLVTLCRIKTVYTRSEFALISGVLFRRRLIFETYRLLHRDQPRFARWIGRLAARKRIVATVVHSNLSRDSLISSGHPPDMIKVFYNGYDPADVEPVMDVLSARCELGLEIQKKYVAYTGNLQYGKGLSVVLQIAKLLPDIGWLLVGGSPDDVLRLQGMCEDLELNNVFFTGHLPNQQAVKYLYAADVLIIPPTAGPLKSAGRTVLPIKTFLYMAIGRPFIAPDLPDLKEILHNGKNALLVSPDNIKESAAAIQKLLEDNTLAEKIAAQAKRDSARLNWRARAHGLAEWFNLVVDGL